MKTAKTPRMRDLGAQETRDRIVVAARAVFRSKGFDKASMRDIIKAAGLSGAGVAYHHFQSKEAIVRSILEEEVTHAFARFSAQVGEDGRMAHMLNMTGADAREWLEASSDDMFFDLWPQLCRHPEFLAFFEEIRHKFDTRMREALRTGIAAGLFAADLDIEEAVASLPILAHGLRMRYFKAPGALDYDRAACTMRQLYRALLRPTQNYPLQNP